MNTTHTLINHQEIQKWISAHQGTPAIAKIRDDVGTEKAKLAISFARPRSKPMSMPTQDDGMSPCSWSAWLAELDRQHLALRVLNQHDPVFEFIERREMQERVN
jgi:hypothetical protein